jgi:succinate dehydrogenase / fumarate reductase, cytochrome b subunit
MTWKHFFTSSIGKKFLMGATGLFLITFLIVHAGINAMIFYRDNGVTFNYWGNFMGSNPIIRTLELGLMGFLVLHIYQGLALWRQNVNARPVKYAVQKGDGKSKWYSKTMGLLGTLILIFLILHFAHFWVPSRFGGMLTIQELAETTLTPEYNNKVVHDLYQKMLNIFTGNYSLIIIIFYVLGCVSLCWHLLHGFQSAFQTFGINHKRYTPMIKTIGVVYSVGISLLFASMPVCMYLGIVK